MTHVMTQVDICGFDFVHRELMRVFPWSPAQHRGNNPICGHKKQQPSSRALRLFHNILLYISASTITSSTYSIPQRPSIAQHALREKRTLAIHQSVQPIRISWFQQYQTLCTDWAVEPAHIWMVPGAPWGEKPVHIFCLSWLCKILPVNNVNPQCFVYM